MKTYNDGLEWAAKWIENTLSFGETNERTIEFGKNMAMTIRAAKEPESKPTVDQVQPGREQEHSFAPKHYKLWICGECLQPFLYGTLRPCACGGIAESASVPLEVAEYHRDDQCAATPAPVPVEQRWKCACGWSGSPSQMQVVNEHRVCPGCGASGGLILDIPAPPETEELLPCSFCGRESKIEAFLIDDDPQWWYVATCPACPVKTYDQTTPLEAARIWNTRATPSLSKDAEKQARQAFEDIAHLAHERLNVPASEVYTLLEHIDRRASAALADLSTGSSDNKGDRD